ncbi:MAG: ACP S-malonyltransferase [Holosporales bacterium]|jgi:[acyl-carrier-protein] S-malonyltransferase|nr:ACP S-malonyltransferase [Holosporales bacterium]
MSNALIFPGQGAQTVGMATAFANGFKAGSDVVEEIDDAVSFKLSKIIEEGPIEELTKTQNAQLAIFAVSMACINILEKEFGYVIKKKCKYLAGHSLGEYSALCAAGVFSISEAAKIIKIRGELMSRENGNDDCCMYALLGVCTAEIEDIVSQYNSGRNICVIANDNSPSEVVISGNKQAVFEVIEKVKNSTNMIKAIKLNTSGPFHSPLMAKAAMEFDGILSKDFKYNDFNVPVIMNVTARPLDKKEDLHECLIRQMTNRVRWRETTDFLINDPEIDKIVEAAPGRKLSKMLKRTYPEANVIPLETVSQIEEFVKSE